MLITIIATFAYLGLATSAGEVRWALAFRWGSACRSRHSLPRRSSHAYVRKKGRKAAALAVRQRVWGSLQSHIVP